MIVSDEVKDYQNENSTNNEENVYDESYLNEVEDKKLESESNEDDDNVLINADLNSENKVSSDENLALLLSDGRNENENSNTRRIVDRVNQFLTILEPKTIRLEIFIALLITLLSFSVLRFVSLIVARD